jgi:hypothetical protein
MSAPKKIDSEESRKRLIERLNETEKFLGPQSPARGVQMSEEELAAEIEKERQRNHSRQGYLNIGL